MNPRPADIALSTDLYELTMGASYHALGLNGTAVFSLFVRELPPQRSFLVAAGIHEALDRLVSLQFDDQALEYLRSTGQIREDFLERLAGLRFTGDIWSVPEGSIVFANEPILEVSAPVIEAQLVETILLNTLHYATAVASKAVRCVLAAPDAHLVDFGLRRTPGIEAGLIAARSSYLVGFHGTSNVLAGQRYGIPVAGTVAHSFIELFPSEAEAFLAFGRTYPAAVTLLIDTYDTVNGAYRTVEVARKLAEEGKQVAAVRLDSGDLEALSHEVRRILDDAGLDHVQIIASGGIDEYELQELTEAGAPINSYGVGTSIGTISDAPSLDMVYKLVEYEGEPALKLSSGKQTLVGPKQVWRRIDGEGRFAGDVIAARDEPSPGEGWRPLLRPVMEQGRPLDLPSLDEQREYHRGEMARLPDELRNIGNQSSYPVEISDTLRRRQQAAEQAVREREGIAP